MRRTSAQGVSESGAGGLTWWVATQVRLLGPALLMARRARIDAAATQDMVRLASSAHQGV